MNRWLVVTLTTAVLVFAILVGVCIANNSGEPNILISDDTNEFSLTEVAILPTANITLPVGEIYDIDLSKVPDEFKSDIGIEFSNECCEMCFSSIKAVKVGKTVVDINYISNDKEYLSQTLIIDVVTEGVTFKYDITCVDFNKFYLVVTPLDNFDADLFSMLYDDSFCVVDSSDYNITITITGNTNLILHYAGEDLFNIPLSFDVSKLNYSIFIGGSKVEKNKLYLIEDVSYDRYNSLTIDISPIDALDETKFYLKSSLSVSGLKVFGNKIGNFEVELYYGDEKLLTFIVEVCEPVATKIVAEDTVRLKVNEHYAVEYEVLPSGYGYSVNLSISGGTLIGKTFYADSAGSYTLTIKVGNISKIINIIVEDTSQNFDLLDRGGAIVSVDAMLLLGDNYFTFSTSLDTFQLYLNDEEIFATSDFIVINANKIGNYILKVYNSEGAIVKTYNFICG